MADDEPQPFMSVDLFAMNGPTGNRGVLAGVHIHYVPTGIDGPEVAGALDALAHSLAGELGDTFRAIKAETN